MYLRPRDQREGEVSLPYDEPLTIEAQGTQPVDKLQALLRAYAKGIRNVKGMMKFEISIKEVK